MTGTIQHHVLTEPQSGQVIDLPVGTRLEVRFNRHGLGRSRWQVEDRPPHLVLLEETGHGFQFLAFGGGDGGPRALRMVRRHRGQLGPPEVRHLTVLVST